MLSWANLYVLPFCGAIPEVHRYNQIMCTPNRQRRVVGASLPEDDPAFR
jgi:hypothetical protein